MRFAGEVPVICSESPFRTPNVLKPRSRVKTWDIQIVLSTSPTLCFLRAHKTSPICLSVAEPNPDFETSVLTKL